MLEMLNQDRFAVVAAEPHLVAMAKPSEQVDRYDGEMFLQHFLDET